MCAFQTLQQRADTAQIANKRSRASVDRFRRCGSRAKPPIKTTTPFIPAAADSLPFLPPSRPRLRPPSSRNLSAPLIVFFALTLAKLDPKRNNKRRNGSS